MTELRTPQINPSGAPDSPDDLEQMLLSPSEIIETKYKGVGIELDRPIDLLTIDKGEEGTEQVAVLARVPFESGDEFVATTRTGDDGESIYEAMIVAAKGDDEVAPRVLKGRVNISGDPSSGKMTKLAVSTHRYKDTAITISLCPDKGIGEVLCARIDDKSTFLEMAIPTDKSRSAQEYIARVRRESYRDPTKISKFRKRLGAVGLALALITNPKGPGNLLVDAAVDPADKIEDVYDTQHIDYNEDFLSRPVYIDHTTADGQIISGEVEFLPGLGQVEGEEYETVTVHGIDPVTGEYDPYDDLPVTKEYLKKKDDLKSAEATRQAQIEQKKLVDATTKRLRELMHAIDTGDKDYINKSASEYESTLVANGGMIREKVDELRSLLDKAKTQEEISALLSQITEAYGVEFEFVNENVSWGDGKGLGGLKGGVKHTKEYAKAAISLMTMFTPEKFNELFDIKKIGFCNGINNGGFLPVGGVATSDSEIYFDASIGSIEALEAGGISGVAAHEMVHRLPSGVGFNESAGSEDIPLTLVSTLFGLPTYPSVYGAYGGDEENRAENGRILLDEGIPDPNKLGFISESSKERLELLTYIESEVPGFGAYLTFIKQEAKGSVPETGPVNNPTEAFQQVVFLLLLGEAARRRKKTVEKQEARGIEIPRRI